MIIQALYNWCDKRVDDLDLDDDLDALKAFGYGMIKGIPEGLMLVGAGVYVLAFSNLIRGKGWTICPKDQGASALFSFIFLEGGVICKYGLLMSAPNELSKKQNPLM